MPFKQHLEPVERSILDILRKEYDCAIIFFNNYTERWCIVQRNKDVIRASFEESMFTLNRSEMHDLDQLLCEEGELKCYQEKK